MRLSEKDLMDDLAREVHKYLLEQSIPFNGGHLVFIPVTDIVKKLNRNHRTIDRRLAVLRSEGLLETLAKKTYGTLYSIVDTEEES